MTQPRGLEESYRHHFIGEWRRHRKMTQQDLADAVGLTKGSVSRIENFETPYTQQSLEAIAKALRCAPSALLTPPRIVESEFILARIDELGLRIEEVADRARVASGTLLRIINGKERPEFDIAESLAKILDLPLPTILFALHAEFADPDTYRARVTGLVSEDDRIERHQFGGIAEITLPFSGWWTPVLRIDTTAYGPRFQMGEYLGYYIPLPNDGIYAVEFSDKFMGRECVVVTTDGEHWLKRPQPGSVKGRFTLVSLNAAVPPVLDAEVARYAAIAWHVPPVNGDFLDDYIGNRSHQLDVVHARLAHYEMHKEYVLPHHKNLPKRQYKKRTKTKA